MKDNILHARYFFPLIIILLLAFSLPAQADKSQHGSDHGKSAKHHQKEKGKKKNEETSLRSAEYVAGISVGISFNDRQRDIARDYYRQEYHSGHCPPGLAKKNNGCMPPGQARKWRIGSPLPREVISYDLPHTMVVQLGIPPEGYRYVRVASDILLMATGTAMIMDAIEDVTSM